MQINDPYEIPLTSNATPSPYEFIDTDNVTVSPYMPKQNHQKFCFVCGQKLDEHWKYCIECGTKLDAT